MATYYIDQEDGTGAAGTVYTSPRNTIPTAVDGDRWGFPVGKTFNVRLSGTGATTFATAGKAIETFVYDPADGSEIKGQFDPYERYKSGRGWPTEAEIAANYAYIDGGVVANSAASAVTEGDARSVISGVGANAILRGLCVQNCWLVGIESINAGVADYTIDSCIVRRIGNISAAPRSPIDTTGIGIRHSRVSAGQLRVYRTFIEDCEEDAIWAADTLGSIAPLIRRNWIRRIGAGVPTVNYHADGIQLGNAPGAFEVTENILETSLPATLIGGSARIGCALLLGSSTGSTGGLVERNVFITNASVFNWGATSGVTVRKNEIVALSNPASLVLLGYDDFALIGTSGSGHTFDANIVRAQRQCQSTGFMFGEVDWMPGAVLKHNVFVGSGAATNNACFDTRASTTATCQNNVFLDFENAIVNTSGGSLATESHNSFWNCARKRSASKTGGVEQSVDASDVVTDPKLSDNYRPMPDSPLIAAGTHVRYGTDLYGNQRFNLPTIGAIEPPRARSAASVRKART